MKPNDFAIDAAIHELFSCLPPEVAKRLKEKYDEDRNAFVEYVSSLTVDKSPNHWATKSCTKCHGRGIIGDITRPNGQTEPLVCGCVEKGYKRWLKEQRKNFNALKGKGT